MRHLAVVALLAAASCERSAPPPPAPTVVPSHAQAEAFAKAFEQAMATCAPAVNDMIDLDTLAKRGLVGRALKPDIARGILAGMRSAGTVRQMLCQQFPPNTSYTLLRVRDVAGAPRPLFRVVIGGEAGFNYQELELSLQADHQVRAVDMYIYTTGENLSLTLGQIINGAVNAGNHGTDIGDAGDAMKRMRGQMNSGDYAGARATLQAMPAEIRDTKGMRIALVQATMNLDEASYLAEIERYKKDFPDDASIDLVSIDGAFLKKDFPGVLAIVDHLDKRLGGDPYLDVLRANAHFVAGDAKAALVDARRATTREPTLRSAWVALAMLDANGGLGAEGVGALQHLATLGVAIDDAFFAANTGIAPLQRTPEFKSWRAAAQAK
jgi:hypothetical protein